MKVFSLFSMLPVLYFIFAHITCKSYADYNSDARDQESNAFNDQRRLTGTILDTAAIYDGVFQPENIIVGVIQNFINFLTSSIGWALILPFYQV